MDDRWLLCSTKWLRDSTQSPQARVTKKLYIVFKYSKLLNKYKMCSRFTYWTIYTMSIFNSLYTIPTTQAKMSASYSHYVSPFSFFLFRFFNFIHLLQWSAVVDQLSTGQRAHRRTDGTPGTLDSAGWRDVPQGCWWCQTVHINTEPGGRATVKSAGSPTSRPSVHLRPPHTHRRKTL